MSDLSAANCGCNSCNSGLFGGNNSCMWLILLLLFCGGGNGCGNGLFGNNNDNNACEWIICLLLLSTFCGNNGCGCN